VVTSRSIRIASSVWSTRASVSASPVLQTRWRAGQVKRVADALRCLRGVADASPFHSSLPPIAAAISSMMSLRHAINSVSEALGFHVSCLLPISLKEVRTAVHAALSSERS